MSGETAGELREKRPQDSAVTEELSFLNDAELREQYRSFVGTARLGKIFEDLDALAANVAHEHAGDSVGEAVAIVTAAVDHGACFSGLPATAAPQSPRTRPLT